MMSTNTFDSLNRTDYPVNSDNDDADDDEKIPRQKNVLSNKHLKLLYFAVWIINKTTNDKNIRNIYFNKLRIFSSIEEQFELLENFYENENTISKSMRKFISEKYKEQKRVEHAKNTAPKGRDQILREAYIDYIIMKFNKRRDTNFVLSDI